MEQYTIDELKNLKGVKFRVTAEQNLQIYKTYPNNHIRYAHYQGSAFLYLHIENGVFTFGYDKPEGENSFNRHPYVEISLVDAIVKDVIDIQETTNILKSVWYENKNNFTACWVSNDIETPSLDNYESVAIVKYSKSYVGFITNCNKSTTIISYRYATPLTKEELDLYLYINCDF